MLAGWFDLITQTVKRGVAVRRLRIISEPISDYHRFEHFTTPLNIEAGEQIRWLPRRKALDIAFPAADFWLIDGKFVRFNLFSGDGGAVEPEATDDAQVASLCTEAFEAAWRRATAHEDFRI